MRAAQETSERVGKATLREHFQPVVLSDAGNRNDAFLAERLSHTGTHSDKQA
jgi:hypothetical protein